MYLDHRVTAKITRILEQIDMSALLMDGNGTVVLKGLKIGEYTVTEDTAWSWRYTPRDGAARTITLQAGKTNSVTYVNERTNNKWLDGNAYYKNVFGTVIETDSGN